MKNPGIYKITNKVNGKIYIGSTNNLDRRRAEHKYKCKSSYKSRSLIRDAILKYGEENFEFIILEKLVNPTLEFLIEREQYYINLFKPEYNLRKYAQINPRKPMTMEFLHKLRTMNIGRKRNNYYRYVPVVVTNGSFSRIFSSTKHAAEYLQVDPSNVTRCAQANRDSINNKIYKCAKHIVKYK